MRKLKWTFGFLIFLIAGCASTPHRPGDTTGSQATHLQISYTLERSSYELQITSPSPKEAAHFKYFLDKDLVREGDASSERYSDFLGKVRGYIQAPQRSVADQESCYGPFMITLEQGGNKQTVNGCRSSDKGGLSKLIRESEFLMSASKKQK